MGAQGSHERAGGGEAAGSGRTYEALGEARPGTDALCRGWFWGHADSTREPPPEELPTCLGPATLPLRLRKEADFYQNFAKYVLCPHYLDRQAKGCPEGKGCPFLGGTAYVRHRDVSQRLAEVPAQHAAGAITRKNELGYLLLKSDAFPGTGTLGLGNSVEDHRAQRRWFEHLLDPARLPSRTKWKQEARDFLAQMVPAGKFKLRDEVAKWWQQMLWAHVLGIALSREEAEAFSDFQQQWLLSAIEPGPASCADAHPRCVPAGKVWGLQRILRAQREYRERVNAALPQGVPSDQRELVAQGVLEMLVFAGGLSVLATIHCACAVLFSNRLLPSPVAVTEANVEAFVYEVTRLFPAVQGFCYWRGGERQVLSLNAALRDPAVWGEEANCFSLKDVELYKHHHVGFANMAQSAPGTYDSKACPGYQLALDVVQAFVLVASAWQATTVPSKPLAYWSPARVPKPQGVHKKWFDDFTVELQDWLDGDQTGEDLLRELGPVDLARLLHNIGMADASDGCVGSTLGRLGPKQDRAAGSKLAMCDSATRVFFELSRKRFKELSERAGSQEPNEAPARPASRYFDLQFEGATDTIRLPAGDSMKRVVRDSIASLMTKLLKHKMSDHCDQSLMVRTKLQRCAAIMLCQQAFHRTESQNPPPHSSARADSYLPKPRAPYLDITTDESQVGIARCGMGQLFLRSNDQEHLAPYGDILCDMSQLADFTVRPAFERLGAAAVFSRGPAGWRLTAIDWKHARKVVRPGDEDWEHAKWVWRCSLVTFMTVAHHLIWSHWIVANALSTSSRESLGPQHPIRRLLQVFTYNTPEINHISALSLFPESGMLHRMSPFPYKELQRILVMATKDFSFKTWPQVYEETRLPPDVKAKLPVFEDGLDVWAALHEFMSGYVAVYYGNDEEVQADGELQEYWKFRSVPQYARALPALSRASLIDHLARGAFDVTAFHEFVGYVVAYTTDPAGAALQVRPGLNMCDLQEFLQVNSLVAGTGTPMPMLVPSGGPGDEDWLALLDLSKAPGRDMRQFQEVARLYHAMMGRMRQISQEVGRRNAKGAGREMPFGQMDPLSFERSVSL